MGRYIGLGADEPGEDSERRVAEALRTLTGDWIVLHHVSWQSKRGRRQGDGEADFVVLHPRKGLLVLEVKGGGIELERGRWFTSDRYGKRHPIKNPYEQATASKHALIGWLAEQGLSGRIRVGHAVVFPHMEQVPPLGPVAHPMITLAKPDLANIEEALSQCIEHWGLTASASAPEMKKVIELLAPTVSVVPTLSSASADAEADLIVLTAEQIAAFSGLRARRGGLVLGGAGTGKSVLAVARAQQLVKDGFRTLLVCYNDLLGEELSARTERPPQLTACTFHTLCFREAHRAKLQVPATRDKVWWEERAPDFLIDACSINESLYDAIVVDEGQDFSPQWFDALRCLILSTKDAPFFVFADPLQDLWQRDWHDGTNFPFAWNLTRNMRNTQPIAERVAAVMGEKAGAGGVLGPAPVWRMSDGPPREGDVTEAVEYLIAQGFGPGTLVVLCRSQRLAGRLRERAIGPFSFGSWGSKGIAVETVRRFKGLESQAVVLALDGCPANDERTLAYVGMSRARSLLLIVGGAADQETVSWTSQP